MQLKQTIYKALILILVMLVSTCSYYNWQWTETEVNLGIADNLMQQPFLALQKLSESSDRSLNVVYDYPRLFAKANSRIIPANDAVLIVSNSEQRLTHEQSQRIVDWVKQGGHLVFSMDTAFYKQVRDIHHPLWRALNVTAIPPKQIEPAQAESGEESTEKNEQKNSDVKPENITPEQQKTNASDKIKAKTDYEVENEAENEINDKADVAADEKGASDENGAADTEDKANNLPKVAEKLEFEGPYSTEFTTQNDKVFFAYLEKSYRISTPQNAKILMRAGDERGDTFVQMKLGQGKVSLLTEVEIWNNRQLNAAHNAYLYHWLVGNSQTIWLFTSAAQAHWLVSLTNWSPSLIGLIILLLVLFIWYQAVQFGPAYAHDETHQHFFNQHIKASAEFYWQHKQQALLIKPLQQQIIEKICKRWPAFRTNNQAQQIDYLVDLTQLDKALIQQSMFAQTNQDERGFTRQVRTLQKIRNLI